MWVSGSVTPGPASLDHETIHVAGRSGGPAADVTGNRDQRNERNNVIELFNHLPDKVPMTR
ncbi:hypothetical protein BN6_13760 [Saccharothrix espanaensis DSM 44229]|uniref:Uncharacterized protein n=1 Tax=Saccharothrix espanaensis (strain ATCC 51144 / DSM 44229 / JCM 9112 / NBRC 15066 / NRRL 15764) TaxID=1179773 RepID=K0JT53_SACES|nr:hypothetical protein BN6_13760 [Saccharothrix espanaensis DSM 44229]